MTLQRHERKAEPGKLVVKVQLLAGTRENMRRDQVMITSKDGAIMLTATLSHLWGVTEALRDRRYAFFECDIETHDPAFASGKPSIELIFGKRVDGWH